MLHLHTRFYTQRFYGLGGRDRVQSRGAVPPPLAPLRPRAQPGHCGDSASQNQERQCVSQPQPARAPCAPGAPGSRLGSRSVHFCRVTNPHPAASELLQTGTLGQCLTFPRPRLVVVHPAASEERTFRCRRSGTARPGLQQGWMVVSAPPVYLRSQATSSLLVVFCFVFLKELGPRKTQLI